MVSYVQSWMKIRKKNEVKREQKRVTVNRYFEKKSGEKGNPTELIFHLEYSEGYGVCSGYI